MFWCYSGPMRLVVTAGLLIASTLAPSLAFAQRFAFERTLQTSARTKLDVTTVRGKIEVVAGTPGRVVVNGDATVRVGWDVPSNAVDLARQVAASPPIDSVGDTVTLAIPADRTVQRAVTVSYRVQVPPETEVLISSESGETSVRGLAGPVDVRTQSATIALQGLSGVTRASTGSGAVSAEGMTGELRVTTTSSSFTGTGLASSLLVRTQSGEVAAVLTATGDVDVETGSSAIRLRGVRGGLTARTQSGRVTVQGSPLRPWIANTGSSSVSLDIEPEVGFSLDASSRSGSVVVEGGAVQGATTKRAARGSVNGGGALVKITTGSGSIRVQIGGR